MISIDEDSKIEFEEIKDEIREEIKLDDDKRTVLTKSSDPEITSLYEKWKRGRLILQPEFQRKFVWDRKKASRLIEPTSRRCAIKRATISYAIDSDF